MRLRKALSFDDVMLVPTFSALKSRSDVDLSTSIAGVRLKIPIISANMSSVTEVEMTKALGDMGGLGIIHRMCSIEEQATMVFRAKYEDVGDITRRVGFSIGVGEDWQARMDACRENGDIVCLDVAHGHHERVFEILQKYYTVYKDYPIIIGQVATAAAVEALVSIIPWKYQSTTAVKASIGGGSLCTTRIQTGYGIPTLQSIFDIKATDIGISLIADGGIKNSGDIVKSLAAGADAVMLGGLLAGTSEAPGAVIKQSGKLYKIYRGSASFGDKGVRGEATKHIEGEETLVPYKGSVVKIVDGLLDGIRSGCSYGGAKNLYQLHEHAEFVEITSHGFKESLPHGS